MPMDWCPARDYAARDVQTEDVAVTEAEWLAATDARAMLAHLSCEGQAGPRQFGSFVAACVRHLAGALPAAFSVYAEEICLRSAAGGGRQKIYGLVDMLVDEMRGNEQLSGSEWRARELVLHALDEVISGLPAATRASSLVERIEEWVDAAESANPVSELRQRLPSLLTDIFGNPFRGEVLEARGAYFKRTWVLDMAERIYDDYEFDCLPLLADALEDTGCTDAELLGHLRGPGPHVRGCWAVDLVLGKS
jgi:hypothetical protein